MGAFEAARGGATTRAAKDGDRAMSDTEGVFGAAEEAAGSAAEQVRSTAPGSHDAGAKAARYVRETASEHPLLVGTAVIAFLGGLLSATATGSGNRRRWQKHARDWRERGKWGG